MSEFPCSADIVYNHVYNHIVIGYNNFLILVLVHLLSANNQRDTKPHAPPLQRNSVGKQEVKSPAPQPVLGHSPIVLPLNIAGNAVNSAAPNLSTVTPQPVIVNNQVFWVLELFLQFFVWTLCKAF